VSYRENQRAAVDAAATAQINAHLLTRNRFEVYQVDGGVRVILGTFRTYLVAKREADRYQRDGIATCFILEWKPERVGEEG
jgi:hypothetical protein